MRKRKHLTGHQRMKIWNRFDRKCACCDTKTRFFRGQWGCYREDNPLATVDHIHPFSKGGQCSNDNYQLLCEPCNLRKGAKVESQELGKISAL